MQWDDIGFLISKNRYNENSVVAEFYTKNHGKSSGLIIDETAAKAERIHADPPPFRRLVRELRNVRLRDSRYNE